MNPVPLTLIGIILTAGAWLVARGRRGRRVDDHPVCRKCRFDLIGKPVDSHACPECGTPLLYSFDVDDGNRKTIGSLIAAGAVMVLVGLLAIGHYVTTVNDINTSRYKPDWWLIHDAVAESYPDGYFVGPERRRNTEELQTRLTAGSISPENQHKIASIGLAMQADLTHSWNPEWGDMIETIHGNGQLSALDWKTYLAQDEPATLDIRPNIRRGDPIPIHIHGHLRGATPLTQQRNSNPDFTAAVAQKTRRVNTWSATFSPDFFDVSGDLSPDQIDWTQLKTGPQSVTITGIGLACAGEKNPLLFANLVRQGTWNLLPNVEKSVTLYHDESLAAEVNKCLHHRDYSPGTNQYEIHVDNAPTDLAFVVVLREDGKEWKCGWPLIVKKGDSCGNTFSFPNNQSIAGHQADVILRPSIAAAATTVNMTRLLDHEFVFKDVVSAKK